MNSSKINSTIKLSKNANRILFVRNLPFGVDGEELYDLFFRYGIVRQIRLGCTPTTSTTADVVFENVVDAQAAKEALNGYTMKIDILLFNTLESIIINEFENVL